MREVILTRNRSIVVPVAAVLACVAIHAPAHAYWDDVHYHLTYAVARLVGYTPEQAYRAAAADLSADYCSATEPTQMTPVDYALGAREDAPAKQAPRWKFHAFVDGTRLAELGGSPDTFEAGSSVEAQANRLREAARGDGQRNPGVLLHFVQDRQAHRGYDSAFGHYFDPDAPEASARRLRERGLAVGGTADWIAHFGARPLGEQLVRTTAEELLIFGSKASPRQRLNALPQAAVEELARELCRVNPAPAGLEASEPALYKAYITSKYEMGAAPALTPAQAESFRRHAEGPDLAAAAEVVQQVLARYGVRESIPDHHAARQRFEYDAEGNVVPGLVDQHVLTGALRVAVQAADGQPRDPVELSILAAPVPPLDEEYVLVAPYEVNVPSTGRWEKIPIGEVIVEVRRDGQLLARRTDVRIDRLEQGTSIALDAAAPGAAEPPAVAEGGATTAVYVLRDGYPKLNPNGEGLRDEQKGQGLVRLMETTLEAGRMVRRHREFHEPSATLHYDCVYEYSIVGSPPATLRKGDSFELQLIGRSSGDKPDGPVAGDAVVGSNGFRMERTGEAHCVLGLVPYTNNDRRASCEVLTRLVLAEDGAPRVRVSVTVDATTAITWEWERREERSAPPPAAEPRPDPSAAPAQAPQRSAVPPRLGLSARSVTSADGRPQLVVSAVEAGSSLEGVAQPGDVLVSLDGTPVALTQDVAGALEDRQPGDTVMVVLRRGEETIAGEVRLLAPKAP